MWRHRARLNLLALLSITVVACEAKQGSADATDGKQAEQPEPADTVRFVRTKLEVGQKRVVTEKPSMDLIGTRTLGDGETKKGRFHYETEHRSTIEFLEFDGRTMLGLIVESAFL
jgi:hypothetical protein